MTTTLHAAATGERPNPSARRALSILAAATLALATLASALAIALLRRPAAPPDRAADTERSATGTAAPAPAAESAPRTEVPRDPDAPTPPSPGSFADYVERLVALGVETTRLVRLGEAEMAGANDARSQAVFAEMMQRCPDADAQALARITDSAPPGGDAPLSDHVRQRVLDLALEHGLQRRNAAIEALDAPRERDAEQQAVDNLVGGMLTACASSEDLAHRLGQGMLAGRPFLGPPHEAAVLDLVASSGAGTFSPAIATALLTTLWHNLERRGLRSSEQLAGLCMLLLDQGNTSERLAACRQLLADPRFRQIVLDHVRDRADVPLAQAMAMAAAQSLPPADALPVLTAAAQVAGGDTAPFLMLGYRDPALLRGEYEQRLATDVEPRLRELLVAGAGFAGAPEGIEVAKLAFASDPDADVRLRAMFVLTARATEALGEATIAAALDDPQIAGDPVRLAGVVHALDNLARAGMTNAIDRLGQRLRACSLLESSRQTLDEILARILPGGGAPR